MDREAFNRFCASFPAAEHVVQWGNADVWKAGGKLFAVCGWADGRDAFTFKVATLPLRYCRSAPASARRPIWRRAG